MTVVKCLYCDTDYPKEETVNGTLTEIGYTCPICLFNERNTNMKERDNENKKWKLAGLVLACVVVVAGCWILMGCTVTATTTSTTHPGGSNLERYNDYRNSQ